MSVSVQLIGDKELQKQIKKLLIRFPEEVRQEVLEVALVDIESYAKGDTPRNVIPVDSGRLRASIHTKFKSGMVKGARMGSETYADKNGKSHDGSLGVAVDINTVVVGTNVKYAAKINREGGGGPNSGRKSGGTKRTKGYGRGFWTKAVANGRVQLRKRLADLVRKIGRFI